MVVMYEGAVYYLCIKFNDASGHQVLLECR